MRLDNYRSFYRRSIEFPEDFWAEQGRAIEWRKGWEEVLDFSDPPLARWFAGGETNLCHNTVDRHLRERSDQNALAYVSSETGERKEYTYRRLYEETNAFAAALKDLGVARGDRVVMYMPMMPEAVFAMLACARLGAIHSFVFRGCTVAYLANRIQEAEAKVVITADAGMSGGKATPCKRFVDAALDSTRFAAGYVVVCRRGLDDSVPMTGGRDLDYAQLRKKHLGAEVPVEWVESSHPSYILHTSGATGAPRMVQRDTGGHAVALAASMRHVFACEPGETMFTASAASDMGWVVGHSYIVYAPLLCGMTSIVYEGSPTRPDPGIWWEIVEEYGANAMLTSPTAIRALRKHGAEHARGHDASSLRNLFLAGEPPGEPASRWISESLGVPAQDTYWQTETGWPILSSLLPGLEEEPEEVDATGFPCHGYDLRVVDRETGEEVPTGEAGVLAIVPPLPPGCAGTARSEEPFTETYFSDFPHPLYSTFDLARRDREGCYFVLGRADDVIESRGQRFGAREIEEAIAERSDSVEEAAAVSAVGDDGVSRTLVYVVLKDGDAVQKEATRAAMVREIKDTIGQKVGDTARPDVVRFVRALPRTRSGKMLHRCIRAVAEGRKVGDLSTLKEPDALEAVRAASPAPNWDSANLIEDEGGKHDG